MYRGQPEISDNITIIIGDRYQIEEKLSHKAGRQTLLALELHTRQRVIIKILQFDSLFVWDDLKLFEREAKTLKHLDHPSIPKYLDYFEIDNEQFRGFPKGYRYAYALVQTYIDAPSLEDTVRQGRKFSQGELEELAVKLLAILTYLHSSNPPVIHRDIKPSNILISNRSGNSVGELYLVDFGSVQTAVSREQGTITIVGSYGYIPLEQFGGQTVPASDLYSLGMTIIYLITGVHPAELPHVNGKVKFSDNESSSKFNRWLKQMTNPHLDKRYDSAKSARTALLSKEKSTNSSRLEPTNKKIKLERDSCKLKVIYPVPKSSEDAIYGCLICLFLLGIMLTISTFELSAVTFLILLSLLVSWIGNWFYYNLLLNPYHYINIEKNKNIIEKGYCNNKLEVKWGKSKHLKITSIAYNSGYTFNKYFNKSNKKIETGRITIAPTLSLYAEEIEYTIDDGTLVAVELLWLGKEIADFLDLELRTIYPTPQI